VGARRLNIPKQALIKGVSAISTTLKFLGDKVRASGDAFEISAFAIFQYDLCV
jgi:hypothetical protein